MVAFEDEVARQLAQWTPLQRELHTIVQQINALPNYIDARMDKTELLAMIRAGIAQHEGSLKAIRALYKQHGADFDPDEEIWKILGENL